MLLAAQLIIDLVLAAAAVLIIILGGALVFGASLHVQILPFVGFAPARDRRDIRAWPGAGGPGALADGRIRSSPGW